MATPHRDRYEATSERVTEAEYQAREGDYLIYLFHLATYDFARRFVKNGRVLDFGCGTGYGAHRIAEDCATVTGVDVAREAIAYARERYRAPNLDFRPIDPVEDASLPFPDACFDAVLSFQVIEHVPDPDRYLAEAHRVLDRGGVLVVATPDRSTRLLPRQRPWNRYHLTEYTPAQLVDVLGRHFAHVEAFGMGADSAILGRELRRSRRLKWLTLPFTFPGSPEPWRQWGLSVLKQVQARARRKAPPPATMEPRAEGAAGGAGLEPADRRRYPYDESAIRIAADCTPSVNIVAIARKS